MRQSVLGKVLGSLAVLLLLLIVTFPIYWMAVSSVKSPREIISRRVTLFPQSFTTQHYEKLLSASNFPTYTFNSTIVAVSTTLISVGLAVLAGYGIYQSKFWGSQTFLRAMLVAYAFPTVLLLVPLYFVLSALGLIDTYYALNHRQRHPDGAFCGLVAAGFLSGRAARCGRCSPRGWRRAALRAVADRNALDCARLSRHRYFLLCHLMDGVSVRLDFDQHRYFPNATARLGGHHRTVSN